MESGSDSTAAVVVVVSSGSESGSDSTAAVVVVTVVVVVLCCSSAAPVLEPHAVRQHAKIITAKYFFIIKIPPYNSFIVQIFLTIMLL